MEAILLPIGSGSGVAIGYVTANHGLLSPRNYLDICDGGSNYS